MLNEVGRGMEMIEKAMTLKKLKAKNSEIFLNHTVNEVINSKIILESEEGIKEINDIDEIVVTVGMKSYIPFEYKGDIPIYLVGDAKKVGKAQEAIYEAYKLAIGL
jgi:hypothetical protein